MFALLQLVEDHRQGYSGSETLAKQEYSVRPTLQDQDPQDDTGRIISLGDVRRRRVGRTRAPDKQYVGAAVTIAGFAWAAWLLVVLVVQPARLLTYVAFFAPLWLALAMTAALAAYGIDWRRGILPRLRICIRRGILASSVIVLNLAFLAGHHWAFLLLPVSIIIAVAADLLVQHVESSD